MSELWKSVESQLLTWCRPVENPQCSLYALGKGKGNPESYMICLKIVKTEKLHCELCSLIFIMLMEYLSILEWEGEGFLINTGCLNMYLF